MLHRPEVFFRKCRNFFSRSKWLIRLLHLSYVSEKPQRRGLLLIQIDALSRAQLEAALAAGKMPFLKNLMEKQRYRLRTHYSGMPCSTPAVQGELFYGVSAAIPSFSFYDTQQQRIFTMFNPAHAEIIQSRLEAKGTGLFENGSCYSNIFTGGAAEPHFCVSDLQFAHLFGQWRTFSFIIAVLLHVYSLLRAAALLVFEFVIAIVDIFRGLYGGRDLWKEIKFIPSRVGICILLREIIVIGTKMDITRGFPVIHANFMGYHEQSHRRGATSRFAHWTLKGIDDAIKRIWKSVHQAEKEYDIWVYSDHGQVDTVPYESVFGKTLQNVVHETLHSEKSARRHFRHHRRPGFRNRLGWRLHKIVQGEFNDLRRDADKALVTALGPYAQVYLDQTHRNAKQSCAQALLDSGKIPLVLIPEKKDGEKVVRVLRKNAEYMLPQEADSFFFENRFVPPEVVQDFVSACHHPSAGDLIICGYQGPGAAYYSFVTENGSHGGVSEQEYSGFLMAPENCPVDFEKEYVRPRDIRHGAFRILDRQVPDETNLSAADDKPLVERFRVMTYNVHSCAGMDGKFSPLRIARVIEQFNPDIVALQELDVGHRRSNHTDQAQVIADILEMDHFFSPAIAMEEEQYGDAILSRFGMRLVKRDILPGHEPGGYREPRGALWVEIDIGSRKLHVLNTHLGLTFGERQQQIETLLGDEWLNSDAFLSRAIFCGDFNFSPRSKLYRQCREALKPAVPSAEPQGTYCGRYPFIHIDHIFFQGDLRLTECITGDTDLARIASDHRPLIAEFQFDK